MKRTATKVVRKMSQHVQHVPVHAVTRNSLAVLKSCILDENYVTVMHVPLSTPVENAFLFRKAWICRLGSIHLSIA